MKKWADKYGVKITIERINDYMLSVSDYTSGNADGVAVTNMDALSNPAVGGVDSTILITGDFSNGNDGVVSHGEKSLCDLKGKEVKLVQFSVSHYLLTRGLKDVCNMTEKSLTLVNASDNQIGALFVSDPKSIVVTWNPILMSIRNEPNATLVFDSSKIPGEIMDLLVVRTDMPDAVKKALVGAWFEAVALMRGTGPQSKEAIKAMADSAGGTEQEFRAQLGTTAMFYTPGEAVTFVTGLKVKQTMDYVRTFLFDHGLFADARSKDQVGIQFPDGTILGDPKNVKLRFDATYMQQAADGKL
jgi:NitT/TauT family transport system substrate-binding protein